MKTIFLLAFSLLCGAVFGQKTVLQGSVTDKSGAALPAVTAVLMTRDSVLHAFATANDQGRFSLKAKIAGQYLLQITYLGYTTHWQAVTVEPGKTEMDLGRIHLEISTEVLPAVEISAERDPMRISRDTVEYNAAAFKVQPGDAVEELLKKMPGIEVQRDGTVKAHGEDVKNVLVDGKEFFGKDTRVATQNLPAEAVDKVQVYDKKSDMAEFTGIEDGQDERTINLKLKEGHKDGYFGKGDAGAGTEGRYEGKFNLNRFTPGDRLSVIGMANNTNQQGFSMDDYMQFMGGIGAMMSGGGGRIQIGGDGGGGIPLNTGQGVQGIRTSLAGGLNWSKDFSKNTELTASYFVNRFRNDLDLSSNSQNLGAGGLFTGTEAEDQLSRNFGHNLSVHFRHRIDSFQSLVLRANSGLNDASFDSRGTTAAFNSLGNLQNEGQRDYRSEGNNYSLRSSLQYRRRFRKPGRAAVAQGSFNLNDRQQDGSLFAVNRLFTQPVLTDTIRQRQDVADGGEQYGLSLTYTEPLGRRRYLEVNASRQNYTNDNRRDFFDLLPGGEVRNENLSNHFRRGYIYDRAGVNLMVNRNKYKLTGGVAFQQSRLENTVVGENRPFNARFSRFLPALFGEYEFATAHNLNFGYTTRFTEPSPEQLQPVVNNSDPLNIYIGNPNLQPEYTHELRTGYFLYDQFSFTSFFANLTGTYTTDKITNATTIDSLLRRTVTPLNVEREMALRGSLQFGAPIRPLKLKFKVQVNSSLAQRILFVNDVRNDVRDWRNGLDFALENRNKDVVDALAGIRLNTTSTDWSVSADLNQQYTNHAWYGEMRYTPAKRWMLETQFDYTVYSEEAFGERTAIPLWRAGVTHYFLKNNRARVRLSVFDLLAQNQGITRSSSLNYVEQQRANALGRYFLLTFGYSLAGFDKQEGGIQIKIN
ncbi:MAG: TonB-dependent receptor [Lewinellaceae bacterium]|nr:TonB-dependent receptor [Lewinellaceae bacterium]